MASRPFSHPRHLAVVSSRFDIAITDLTLAGLRRGDVRAQETVYRSFETPVFDLAVRLTGCRHLAADITQDTFLRVFDKARAFRGDSPFWGWLRQIAVREALQVIRKRKRWLLGSDEMPEPEAPPDADDTLLEQSLAALPATARAVVWLYHVEGYTHPEIAELTGKTASFSKSQLSRAHARLRETLNPGADASPVPNDPAPVRTEPAMHAQRQEAAPCPSVLSTS